MLLKDYEQQGLFFNANLTETCSDGKLSVYRGDFAIQLGEVADAQGRRSAPTKMLNQVVFLASDQLAFVAGQLDSISDLAETLAILKPNMVSETLTVIFVYDIDKPVSVTGQTGTIYVMPMDDGLVWTELMDMATLEKGDMKGLSSADKVLAVFRELISYKPRGGIEADLAQAAALSNGKVREVRGAV